MTSAKNAVPPAIQRDLYARMVLIRELEQKIARLYPEQEMRCPTHLSIGQEAVAAGVCAALEREDSIFLNHRCHAAYIAKGGDIGRMLAELYGKKTGCAKGKGGSMHLVDPSVGALGTSAIVAGTIPIACGAGLSYARLGQKRVAACFFGDAAVEEGTFFESLNIASLWKLPVLFICENNLYSTCTPLGKRQAPGAIYKRVLPFGMDSLCIDGNDVLEVYRTARRAVRKARLGKGPTFIECRTYRWLEHVGPNTDWSMGYRTKKEVEFWMKRCPIKTHEKKLSRILPPSERARIREEILKRVEEAVRFAKDSPFPEAHELLEDFADA